MATRWTALFEAWQRAVIAADEEPRSETLFRAPAQPDAIEALETRLGTSLPPSYRAFLEHTDGALAFPGLGAVREGLEREPSDGLLPADRVTWLRDADPTMVGWLGGAEQAGDPTWFHQAFAATGTEREYLYPVLPNDPLNAKGGHLAYGLAISVIVDGYHTLLDPLVVDADGEWEAWDAGIKLPGAVRYPSFAALLEADTARLREQVDQEARAKAGVATFVETVRDASATLDARIAAAWQAFGAGARSELVPALAGVALDPRLDTTTRQRALQLLGYVHDRPALDALALASRDPEPRILAVAVPPLAASDDPADREVAIRILADPTTPSFVARSTYRPSGDVVWEAYRRSGNPALLPHLASLGEARATDDVLAALRDEDRPEEDLRDLLVYAYNLRDPRIAQALAACSRRFPVWRTNIGGYLVSAGALDEAIPLLTEAMLAGEGFGQAEASLVQSRDPRAGAALLRGLRERPTAATAGALGWFPSPEAVAELDGILDDPGLHLAAIDALELMATTEARDTLAARAGAGDVLATRALARVRDRRSRGPLLAWLDDPDPGLARAAADGLRDLRDPETAEALLGAASHPDADVAVIAVHALVSMRSPRLRDGLAALGSHDDPRAHELAARWTVMLDEARI